MECQVCKQDGRRRRAIRFVQGIKRTDDGNVSVEESYLCGVHFAPFVQEQERKGYRCSVERV